jgi:precorrin-2/cobalt-factor-2 C20-methyltransferase
MADVGKMYGIGIGPGDAELVTLKAVRIVSQVESVFVPTSPKSGESLARKILTRALEIHDGGVASIDFRPLTFPMTRDARDLRERWSLAAQTVAEVLTTGADAAFITLGDPALYSTWTYLARELHENFPEIEIETVPGVAAFSAGAAAANLPLIEGEQRLSLLPLPEDLSELTKLLEHFDTLSVYKIGHRLQEVLVHLRSKNFGGTVCFCSRVGLEDEVLFRDLSEIPEEQEGYLSMMILKREAMRAMKE